jgi:hypothetical protein
MFKHSSSLLLLAALLFCSVPASAQLYVYDWSLPGATGDVDPSSAAHAFFGPGLTFASGVTGTIKVRYGIQNIYDADVTPSWQYLILSRANNSALGSVTARLMRVDHCSGDEEQMCSTGGSGEASGCSRCLFNPGELDFSDNSYYIEVTLTRSSTTATPVVNTVALGN